MSRILVVDSERNVRIALCEFLEKEQHKVDVAESESVAVDKVSQNEYDIVITGSICPKEFGMNLLETIHSKSKTTQIIILSEEPDVNAAIKAVRLGTDSFFKKPLQKKILAKPITDTNKTDLLYVTNNILKKRNLLYQKKLEDTVAMKTTALQEAMQSIISLLASVVEARDPFTAGHQRRVGNLSAMIAAKMGLDSDTIDYIRIIGYIHDIGKIAIPAEILFKPGNLSWVEMAMIRNHPQTGYDLLEKVGLPEIIGKTICQHHERCDGSGYPNQLMQDEITIEAQIIMISDVIEAMIYPRTYHPAFGLEVALGEINQHSGTLFNPSAVAACTELFLVDHYEIDEVAYQINFPIKNTL